MLQAIGEGLSIREIKPTTVPDPNDPRKRKTVMPEPFKRETVLGPQSRIHGGSIDIPGDVSTAAFFFAAAAISGQSVTIINVGLNPTRIAFLEHLKAIGAGVQISGKSTISREPRGNVTVSGGQLKARKVAGETVVGLIDEIPTVGVLAAFAEGTTVIRDAGELRVKESDRLTALRENLSRMGVKCGLLEDGLAIEGKKEPAGADFSCFGDHRIAMAFSVASLFLTGPSSIDDDSIVAISCPNFYELLNSVTS
jgi:3-phosphoshikimate 1-carboxyvinyltransferase